MKFVAQIDYRADKQGDHRVMIRCIFEGGEQRYIDTLVKCKRAQWGKRKRVLNDEKKNMVIERQLRKVYDWRFQQITEGKRITAALFDDWMKYGASADTFNVFCVRVLEKDNMLTDASKRSQMRTIQLINQFKPDIYFNQINRKIVIDFHNFIAGFGFAQNTIKKHHKDLKKFINRAIDENKLNVLLGQHPYRGFSVPATQSDRVFLSIREMEILRNTAMVGTQSQVRDLFLFSCDTGIRFSDTQDSSIQFDDEWIAYKPKKTQRYTGLVRVPYNVMQFPNHVKACKDNLLKISNQEANRYLKNIMIDCEIEKLLTFHVSRHTFCTNVARKTGNLFKLMKYAGLRKTDTAMVYIHLAGV
jgi:integrase